MLWTMGTLEPYPENDDRWIAIQQTNSPGDLPEQYRDELFIFLNTPALYKSTFRRLLNMESMRFLTVFSIAKTHAFRLRNEVMVNYNSITLDDLVLISQRTEKTPPLIRLKVMELVHQHKTDHSLLARKFGVSSATIWNWLYSPLPKSYEQWGIAIG